MLLFDKSFFFKKNECDKFKPSSKNFALHNVTFRFEKGHQVSNIVQEQASFAARGLNFFLQTEENETYYSFYTRKFQ